MTVESDEPTNVVEFDRDPRPAPTFDERLIPLFVALDSAEKAVADARRELRLIVEEWRNQ